MKWLIVAGVNGFLAVGAGAFGAHGLQASVPPGALSAFETGAQYHLLHSVVLALVGLLAALKPDHRVAALGVAGWAFVAGICAFSGSLYVYGVSQWRPAVYVTPFGGVAYMAGWLALAWAGWRLGWREI